jgi:cytochrome c oxidase cbb3-type subunit 3
MSQDKKDQDLLLDHDYDGIKEYDNPLPTWWLITFFGTVIFGFLYWIHYEFGGGASLAQELEVAMKDVQSLQAAAKQAPAAASAQVEETEDSLKAIMDKKDTQAQGKVVYAAKCASCHGPELQGLVGPNLVDKAWIHGKGTRVDIIKVVREGVLDKGMPGWASMMSGDDVVAVVSYIVSQKGTNPANPKAPQGNIVE